MTAVVNPLPRTPEEVMAWFAALSADDWQRAIMGVAAVAIVGLLLVLGTMALLRWGR